MNKNEKIIQIMNFAKNKTFVERFLYYSIDKNGNFFNVHSDFKDNETDINIKFICENRPKHTLNEAEQIKIFGNWYSETFL